MGDYVTSRGVHVSVDDATAAVMGYRPATAAKAPEPEPDAPAKKTTTKKTTRRRSSSDDDDA